MRDISSSITPFRRISDWKDEVAPEFRFRSSLLAAAFAILSLGSCTREVPRQLDCESTFPPATSAASLAERFGPDRISPARIDVGEGTFEEGSILLPDQPADALEIIWKDPVRRRNPASVRLHGDASAWRTAQGITLGTDLASLESMNGRPFTLMGFGWDYGGTVVSWSGGRLEREFRGCRLLVRLAPEMQEADPQRSDTYDEVVGEREFSSSHAAMQALNPKALVVMLIY
jgi:hypothetical protein